VSAGQRIRLVLVRDLAEFIETGLEAGISRSIKTGRMMGVLVLPAAISLRLFSPRREDANVTELDADAAGSVIFATAENSRSSSRADRRLYRHEAIDITA